MADASNDEYDFSDLSALYFNCTLKKSPELSHTQAVIDISANIMRKTGRDEKQARAELAAHNPQGRLVQPEEVANAVRWLCLPQSAAMNGQAIAVAGGEVM